jgi:integrase
MGSARRSPNALVPVDRSKLVKLERHPLVETPAPAVDVPDERDAAWWLENIGKSKPGRYRRPGPPKPSTLGELAEIGLSAGAVTKEQFELLKPALDAVEGNARFERAENTQAAYAHEWRTFVRWASARGLKVMPARPEVVQAYIADVSAHERPRVVKGTRKADAPPLKPLPPRKPKGLEVALAAIAHYHKKYNYPSPHDSQVVVEELERIRRRVHVAPTQKLPLTVDHLEQIVALLEADRRKPGGRTNLQRKAAARRAIRDKAMLLVGFAGAFRRDELASLNFSDVAFRPEGLDAALAKSKTDQTGKGFIKAIPKGRESTCPKRALEDWIASMGVTSGPVFREIDRFNRLVLNTIDRPGMTGDAVARVVKKHVRRIGLDPDRYSGHSLRSGLITAAAEAGRSVHEIMSLSGHKDPATVYVYIRSAQRFESSPGRGLL